MGKLFGKCANCGAAIIGGVQEGDNRFCSKECHHFFQHPGFCEQCMADTSAEPVGGTFTLNVLFGTRLMSWGGENCPRCYSRVMRKWLWFLIPLFPVSAHYRVKYQTRKQYFSRRMKTVAS